MRGLVTAARDVNVRHSAGTHSVGTVFAFVSTGFLFGGAVALPIYGLILDHAPPQTVFLVSAVMTLGAILATVLHKHASQERA
jgi:MFS family permease